ncbi:hypothetical protein TCAL_16407 [Tigriopus californicus]|uniref:Uncharacterized protein n=1 Tax=Tigriopus californicus TaxID=6832 RepID=A0A553P0K1_TIGCA|nr:hypothetical protein TCAL_16407 [Tigriopus californicus]
MGGRKRSAQRRLAIPPPNVDLRAILNPSPERPASPSPPTPPTPPSPPAPPDRWDRSERRRWRHSLESRPRSPVVIPRAPPRRSRSPGMPPSKTRRMSAATQGTSGSWEDRVNAFMQSLGAPTPPSPPLGSSPGPSDPPPPGIEEDEEAFDDLKATPLIRYVAGKIIELKLEGVFQYNLLSLLSRSEWVAARAIELLAQAGYDESTLYLMATTQGGPALEAELKSAVFTGKVRIGPKPELLSQVLRVIEGVVKYFTAQGDESSSDDELDPVEDTTENKLRANRIQSGLGSTLARLASQKAQEKVENAEEIMPEQPPENPWTHMYDHIQAQSLKSYSEMKTFLAKDLLRIADDNISPSGKGFDIAQDMVLSLVLVGYRLENLQQLVHQTPAEDILPPKEGLMSAERGKRFLFHVVLRRLKSMRANLPPLSDLQLEYLVRKALTFVMRGCDKMPVQTKAPPGCNIVFNYLPPGLRESENQGQNGLISSEDYDQNRLIDEGETPKNGAPINAEDKESTDPLNSILNPQSTEASSRSNEMPSRKYLLGYIHLEWVSIRGRPQIYEVSLQMSDMSSMNLYTMTEPLMKASETLEILGFVRNPDRQEVYFVQEGLGCTKALRLDKAFEKVSKFLEEKRNLSTGENKNNGLILVCYSEEELALIHRTFEETGHKNLFIDVVKGFGCVEHFIDRNKSKKYFYGGPKFNVSGEDSFYQTELKRGIHATHSISKSKAGSLSQALEYFLESAPQYKNFILPTCCPSLSPKLLEIRRKLVQIEEMYHLEVYIAAQLKNQRTQLFLEGIFQAHMGKDIRDKPSVVASRFCRLLVEAGFDKGTLSRCFAKNQDFSINSSVFLDKMNMSQRLQVMDQTMRCIRLIQTYFQPQNPESDHQG